MIMKCIFLKMYISEYLWKKSSTFWYTNAFTYQYTTQNTQDIHLRTCFGSLSTITYSRLPNCQIDKAFRKTSIEFDPSSNPTPAVAQNFITVMQRANLTIEHVKANQDTMNTVLSITAQFSRIMGIPDTINSPVVFAQDKMFLNLL